MNLYKYEYTEAEHINYIMVFWAPDEKVAAIIVWSALIDDPDWENGSFQEDEIASYIKELSIPGKLGDMIVYLTHEKEWNNV